MCGTRRGSSGLSHAKIWPTLAVRSALLAPLVDAFGVEPTPLVSLCCTGHAQETPSNTHASQPSYGSMNVKLPAIDSRGLRRHTFAKREMCVTPH